MPESSKVIRKRIKSVASTKKITRTMEMVATSKLQRTQGRVVQSRPYMESLRGLMETLSSAVESIGLSPLFERRNPVKKVLVLLITANRGLCGGFNANLVKKCREHLASLEDEGIEAELWVAGKKGVGQLRFRGYSMEQTFTELSDNPTFDNAEEMANPLIEAFLSAQVDRVDVVYADFQTVGRQPPTAQTLLPVGGTAQSEDSDAVRELGDFIFEPNATEILDELGPLFVKNLMYRVLLSSVASEQLARRVAMKNATDNAAEMQKALTRQYNKARQAQITQEIAEIVGGVEALK